MVAVLAEMKVRQVMRKLEHWINSLSFQMKAYEYWMVAGFD